ncbi:ATP-binding protein [Allosalinactinospora lopnorensis]|uniref:ATP-binding protein n=1 Tax=Allosalinactinospora lopnorensis TaxID=1352348 RepID=UPI000695D547|nr:ATP-binding protein [Allosalinactinospora lopnorensis]
MMFETVDGQRNDAILPNRDLVAPHTATFRLTQQDRPLDRLPSIARRLVTEQLRKWGTAFLIDDAQTVTSELVTNAVRHAVLYPSDQVLLSLLPEPGSIWIGIVDPSPEPPGPGDSDSLTDSGRGLSLIVNELTDGQWGWEALPNGKIVWARLRRE